MDSLGKLKDAASSLLVFIVPGALSIILFDSQVLALTGFTVDKKLILSNAAALLLVSMGIGLVLYAYWGVLFRVVSILFKFRPLSPKDVEELEKDNLEKIKLTYDFDFRLYQMYGSLGVLFLICAASSVISIEFTKGAIFTITAAMCIASAVFSYLVFMRRMKNLVRSLILMKEK